MEKITILEDVGQKILKHRTKEMFFKENNINMFRLPLPFGDYILCDENVQAIINKKDERMTVIHKMDLIGSFTKSVDTKKDIQEIYGNIVNDHSRFTDELLLAQRNNTQLYILIENMDGVRDIEDLKKWENPRIKLWPGAVRAQFYKYADDHFKIGPVIKYLDRLNIEIPGAHENDGDFERWVINLKRVYKKVLLKLKTERMIFELKINKQRIKKKPVNGEQLAKCMITMQEKYGVKFLFCTPPKSGEKVIELLTQT